jgi:Tfp pilus assembly protein PilF
MTKDWTRAQSASDFARTNNLDSLNGLTYEAELANARGWDLINAKKPAEAKAYFEQSAKAAEQVVKQIPNDSQTRAILGEAYWWLDRRTEAGIQISKAIELNAHNPFAMRAACLANWEAISSGSQIGPEVFRQFAENLQNAYQQMPWDSWLKDRMDWLKSTITKQREYLADEKDPAAAVVERREKIRKTSPQDVDNLVRLAAVYENRKEVRDLDKAEACYKEALGTKATIDLVRMYMAFANRNNRLANMEAFLTNLAASEAKKGKGDGYTLLGYYDLAVQKQADAEKAFMEAVKVEDTAGKRMDLAILYSQTGNSEKVVEWARKVLDAKPENRQERSARSMLISSLISLQRWDEAAKDIAEFRKVFPTDPQGRLFEAQLAMGQGKLSEADGILTQLLTQSPDLVDALNLRSLVYQYTWQLEKAQADLEKIRDINPRGFNLSSQLRLVKVYAEMGKTSDVEQQARAIIENAKGQSGEVLEMIRQELLPSVASSLDARSYESL